MEQCEEKEALRTPVMERFKKQTKGVGEPPVGAEEREDDPANVRNRNIRNVSPPMAYQYDSA
jgi:hypothetical protein